MSRTAIRLAAASVFLGLAIGSGVPAFAANPLAALPVGKGVTYHIVTQTNKPELAGGQSSTSNNVRIVRAAGATFNVQVDGAPAGQITLNADGSPNVPPSLKKVLAPFGEAALLMRGAPRPLAANSSWSANVPIPLGDSTDVLPTTVTVAHLGETGATIEASGQNQTEVQPGLRAHPTNVNLTASLHFNPARVLTFANSHVEVAVKKGAIRQKDATSSWTLSLIGQ